MRRRRRSSCGSRPAWAARCDPPFAVVSSERRGVERERRRSRARDAEPRATERRRARLPDARVGVGDHPTHTRALGARSSRGRPREAGSLLSPLLPPSRRAAASVFFPPPARVRTRTTRERRASPVRRGDAAGSTTSAADRAAHRRRVASSLCARRARARVAPSSRFGARDRVLVPSRARNHRFARDLSRALLPVRRAPSRPRPPGSRARVASSTDSRAISRALLPAVRRRARSRPPPPPGSHGDATRRDATRRDATAAADRAAPATRLHARLPRAGAPQRRAYSRDGRWGSVCGASGSRLSTPRRVARREDGSWCCWIASGSSRRDLASEANLSPRRHDDAESARRAPAAPPLPAGSPSRSSGSAATATRARSTAAAAAATRRTPRAGGGRTGPRCRAATAAASDRGRGGDSAREIG